MSFAMSFAVSFAVSFTGAVTALALAGCGPRPSGEVRALVTASPPAPRRDARPGDLVVRNASGASLVVAAAPDAPGAEPHRGAIVDVALEPRAGSPGTAPAGDELVWWRVGVSDSRGAFTEATTTGVTAIRCANRDAGVRVEATAGALRLRSDLCAAGDRFTWTTVALGPLPASSRVTDALQVGNRPVLTEHGLALAAGHLLAFGSDAFGVALETAAPFTLRRGAPDAHELAQSVLYSAHAGPVVQRTLRVVSGDALSALGTTSRATRSYSLRGGADRFELFDRAHDHVAAGALTGGARALRLPPAFAASVRFLYAGVGTDEVPLTEGVVEAPVPRSGSLAVNLRDEAGRPLPAHVLVRPLDGAREPAIYLAPSARAFAGGRSVYLLDGAATFALTPGRYLVTASHGPRYSLVRRELRVEPGATERFEGTLREVVATPGWVSGDFHLHASPSPDSHVSLAHRVGALYCEGVDVAVPTDHNHVTDYGPTLEALGIAAASIATTPGTEVTTFGPSWGHFNAWPVRSGDARRPAVAYLDTTPARIFAAARAAGAAVVQVNHPRLGPNMGYFDFTHLDPATGAASREFAEGFDAVEVFNGWMIEHPEATRRWARDLTALARRGMRVAATGNSDSHLLLYEEAGWPRTYVRVEPGPRPLIERVTEALRAGRTTISAGPFVELTVDGRPVGDLVRPARAGSVRVHVRVQAPAWVSVSRVELWRDGEPVLQRAVPGPAVDGVRADFESDVEVPRDAVLLAWAEGDEPLPEVLPYAHAVPLGLSGPVYIDADGDGALRVPAAQGAPEAR